MDSISLMNSFDDQGIHELIAQISADQETLIGDRQKIHRDCLNKLQKSRLKDYRQQLIAEMETAKAAGDQERLDQLTREFNQTIKK